MSPKPNSNGRTNHQVNVPRTKLNLNLYIFFAFHVRKLARTHEGTVALFKTSETRENTRKSEETRESTRIYEKIRMKIWAKKYENMGIPGESRLQCVYDSAALRATSTCCYCSGLR